MKKTIKAVVALALVAVLAVSFAGCAKINYVTNGAIQAMNEVKSGDWLKTDEDTNANSDEDAPVIDELTPGTYGGVEFNDLNDVAAFYAEAYDNTKAKTAQFKTEEGTETFYDFLGTDNLVGENILVDGKPNSTLENLAPKLLGSVYHSNINGLPPSANRNPEKDIDINGVSMQTSRLTGDDLLAANVVDNGDGTITLTMQPKAFNMSVPGQDSQGRMFSTLGDLGPTVEGVGVTWATGTTEENCVAVYKGGTSIIKIDTASKEIVEADYHEVTYVTVQHANIAIIKDKGISFTVKYDQHFPCDDQDLQDIKGITRIG